VLRDRREVLVIPAAEVAPARLFLTERRFCCCCSGPYLTSIADPASRARSRSVTVEPGVIGCLSRTFSSRVWRCSGLSIEEGSLERRPGLASARLRSFGSFLARCARVSFLVAIVYRRALSAARPRLLPIVLG
jgi:hypothetical protein